MAAGLEAQAIPITTSNITQVLFLGGKRNLACFAPKHQVGSLSRAKLELGVSFRAIKTKARLRQLTSLIKQASYNLKQASGAGLALSRALRKRLSTLKLLRAQLKVAIQVCRFWTPSSGSDSSLSQGSSSSQSRGKTFYLDAVNGNDASDGLTAQTAWKTLAKAYPAAAGVQSGDTVILADTPVYAALDGLQVSPRIDGISLSTADTPWSSDVPGVSTVGEAQSWFPTQVANKITIPANFSASQKIAYAAFEPLNLSGFSKVRLHFWLRQENEGATQSDQDKIRPNNLRIVLCSDEFCNQPVAEKVIDFSIYMGWYFAHLDLSALGALSSVQSIGLYASANWNYPAQAYLWIDDVYLADGDMHMRLTKPGHGYMFHPNDVAKITQGLNDNADSKFFPVASSDADTLTLVNNYGLGNQFESNVSAVIRDRGYGGFVYRPNAAANTDWITYKSSGPGRAVLDGVVLGGDNSGQFNGDYYLRFENIDVELITNPRSYLAFMAGVGHVSFDQCRFLGANKYLSMSFLTGRSLSAFSRQIDISNSEISRVDRGITFEKCSSCSARKNSIYDVSGSGLHLGSGSSEVLIENNTFARRRTGRDQWWFNSPHGGGISFWPCHNVTVRGNTVRDGYTRGIGYYSGDIYDITFERNVIYDIGGAYLITPNASGDTMGALWFLNNTVISYRNYSYVPHPGELTSYLNVYPQSIVLSVRDYPNSLLRSNRIENNIFVGRTSIVGSNLTEKNNLVFAGQSSQQNWDPSSLLLAPEIAQNHLSLNVLEEHFFVQPNFNQDHHQECNYHPFAASLACEMPLGPAGADDCVANMP